MHKCKIKTLKDDNLKFHPNYKDFLDKNKKDIATVELQNPIESLMYIKGSRKEENIAMKRNMFGLFTIEVLVFGKRLNFLVDTGAQMSALKKEIAVDLNMELSDTGIDVGSISGASKEMKTFVCPYIVFANQILTEVPMIALDSMKLEIPIIKKDILNLDGILGWNVLSHFDFEIDDVNKRFRIINNNYDFDHQNMIKAPFPTLIVEDMHQELKLFGIDTGARVGWLSQEYMENRFDIDKTRDLNIIGFGVHGKEEMQLRSLDKYSCKLSRAEIKLKQVMSGRVDLLPGVDYTGVLGNEIFRNRKIRFINSKSMILFA